MTACAIMPLLTLHCLGGMPPPVRCMCVLQRNIRVYNLLSQSLDKKLVSGAKWISSMDVHPTGDHIILGSYDKKVVWFDLELSSQPFKVLRYNKEAVRSVQYHPSYPLMASAGDDGAVHVLHAKVFGDFLQARACPAMWLWLWLWLYLCMCYTLSAGTHALRLALAEPFDCAREGTARAQGDGGSPGYPVVHVASHTAVVVHCWCRPRCQVVPEHSLSVRCWSGRDIATRCKLVTKHLLVHSNHAYTHAYTHTHKHGRVTHEYEMDGSDLCSTHTSPLRLAPWLLCWRRGRHGWWRWRWGWWRMGPGVAPWLYGRLHCPGAVASRPTLCGPSLLPPRHRTTVGRRCGRSGHGRCPQRPPWF